MGVEIPKAVQELSDQPVFCFRAAVLQNRPGNGLNLLREPLCGWVEVDASPQHHVVKSAGFQTNGSLRQDAADLFAMEENVVDPFNAGLLPGHRFYGLTHRRRSRRRKAGRLLGRVGRRAEQQTQVYAGINRRKELSPIAPPPVGLLAGDNDAAFRAALIGLFPDKGVGGGRGGKYRQIQIPVFRLQKSADALRGQDVRIRGETVALIGCGVDGVAVFPEGVHCFPHGCTGDLKRPGNFLPGEKCPLAVFQQGKQLFLGGHGVSSLYWHKSVH